MHVVLTVYRRKITTPRGAVKLLHGVEQDGKGAFEGKTRIEAQIAYMDLERKLKSEGHTVETASRNWYGKF